MSHIFISHASEDDPFVAELRRNLAALGHWFDEEPLALPIELEPGALAAALPGIMAALGEELPDDDVPLAETPLRPVDELVLKLEDPAIVTRQGQTRAKATARLVYQPADPALRAIESGRYPFTAPLGPVELDEIRRYLEEFYLWPVGVFAGRAQRTAGQLPEWGRALYDAALGDEAAGAALRAWRAAPGDHVRRFSVWVDREPPKGARKDRREKAHLAASKLLALPWELLHDEGGFLLHGANPVQIRRRLPNRKRQERAIAKTPIRILLLSPRPELDATGQHEVGYIEHRASALPLAQAAAELGDLARLAVLHQPTLPALQAELARARDAGGGGAAGSG